MAKGNRGGKRSNNGGAIAIGTSDLDYTKVPQDNISYKPITNSCDRVNNTLTEQLARKIEYNLGLEKGALKTFDGKTPVIDVHNQNKEV